MVPTDRGETTWLESQFPPLSFYEQITVSSITLIEDDCLHANGMRLLQYHNVTYVMICCQQLYTRCLCYASKNQSVNVVQWNSRCLFWDPHKTQIHCVGQNVELLNVKLVVHIVTTVCLYVYVWLPWLRFFRAFSSVVRQIPGWNPQRRATARILPNFCVVLCIFLCCSMYFFVLFYVFLCCSMYFLCCSMYFCVLCVFVLFYVFFLCCSMYFFVLFYVLFVLCRSLYCLCVYVYWTTATGWLPNCS